MIREKDRSCTGWSGDSGRLFPVLQNELAPEPLIEGVFQKFRKIFHGEVPGGPATEAQYYETCEFQAGNPEQCFAAVMH